MSLWQFNAIKDGFMLMNGSESGTPGAAAPSEAEFDAILEKFGDF